MRPLNLSCLVRATKRALLPAITGFLLANATPALATEGVLELPKITVTPIYMPGIYVVLDLGSGTITVTPESGYTGLNSGGAGTTTTSDPCIGIQHVGSASYLTGEVYRLHFGSNSTGWFVQSVEKIVSFEDGSVWRGTITEAAPVVNGMMYDFNGNPVTMPTDELSSSTPTGTMLTVTLAVSATFVPNSGVTSTSNPGSGYSTGSFTQYLTEDGTSQTAGTTANTGGFYHADGTYGLSSNYLGSTTGQKVNREITITRNGNVQAKHLNSYGGPCGDGGNGGSSGE